MNGLLGIVVSEADPASMRIGAALQRLTDWDPSDGAAVGAGGTGSLARTDDAVRLTVDRRPLDCERIVEPFLEAGHDPDRIVFASRHAGETGPLLTAHHTGNAGPADHGGDPETLAPPAPAATRRALRALDRHAPDGYDVAMECTHHGPTDVGAPSLFVEVGSGPEQWRDDTAVAAAARAILALREVGRGGVRSGEPSPGSVVDTTPPGSAGSLARRPGPSVTCWRTGVWTRCPIPERRPAGGCCRLPSERAGQTTRSSPATTPPSVASWRTPARGWWTRRGSGRSAARHCRWSTRLRTASVPLATACS